jgi:radical SAM protein with 4Fe4S-binding SPASM domain
MLADVLNYTRKLTLRKAWNYLLVEISFFLSNLLKNPIIWGRPWFVSIEPSSVCNLSCPQCPVGEGDISRDRKFLDVGEYKKLLAGIAPTTSMLSLYFQGEPLMHKLFTEFVRIASDHGIYTQTSTNGQLLSKELCRDLVQAGLDRIIVSVDGLDQESYEKYRKGGDLEKVKKGIKNLVMTRQIVGSKKPLIILQFLVFKHNQNQISGVKTMGKRLGADRVWIKTAQVEYSETADDWIPDKQKYNRYEKIFSGEWKLKGRLKNRCKRLWETTVITSDGLVVPCCFDKRARFPMGRTSDEKLEEIWKSRKYQDFRKKVLSDRKSISICTNCTEGIAGTKQSLYPSP